MRIVMVVCAALLCATACKHECERGETRCDGNNAEMCNKDNTWDMVMDCAELSKSTELDLKCSVEPEGAVCIMVEE